jgi:hypothetical protein
VCGATGRVLRAGKREVIGNLNKKLGQLIGLNVALLVYQFLKFFPPVFVSLYEGRFAHISKGGR